MPLDNLFNALLLLLRPLPALSGLGNMMPRKRISFIFIALQPIVSQFRRLIIFARFRLGRRMVYIELILSNLYTLIIQSP
jgi:hypothetical protein